MLIKIGNRWWLILLITFATAFAGIVAASIINFTRQPLYIGRTTIMTPHGDTAGFARLATGRQVLSNSSKTLADRGIRMSPKQILSAMAIVPVKDTYIIAIEVTLPDPKQAKETADVIAAELQRDYAQLHPPKPGQRSMNTIDPAYVHKIDSHQGLVLLLGLFAGLFTGTLLGIIIAAVMPNKETNFAS